LPSDLSGFSEEPVAMDALESPRLAASERGAGHSLRHHFWELAIILTFAAAHGG
jgi:hypothetical protein